MVALAVATILVACGIEGDARIADRTAAPAQAQAATSPPAQPTPTTPAPLTEEDRLCQLGPEHEQGDGFLTLADLGPPVEIERPYGLDETFGLRFTYKNEGDVIEIDLTGLGQERVQRYVDEAYVCFDSFPTKPRVLEEELPQAHLEFILLDAAEELGLSTEQLVTASKNFDAWPPASLAELVSSLGEDPEKLLNVANDIAASLDPSTPVDEIERLLNDPGALILQGFLLVDDTDYQRLLQDSDGLVLVIDVRPIRVATDSLRAVFDPSLGPFEYDAYRARCLTHSEFQVRAWSGAVSAHQWSYRPYEHHGWATADAKNSPFSPVLSHSTRTRRSYDAGVHGSQKASTYSFEFLWNSSWTQGAGGGC